MGGQLVMKIMSLLLFIHVAVLVLSCAGLELAKVNALEHNKVLNLGANILR